MKHTRAEVETCIRLCRELYHAANIWNAAGMPHQEDLAREFSERYIWGEAQYYRRKPGPRDRYHWITFRSPMAIVREIGGKLYVAFRGTQYGPEWNSNARFQTRPFMVDGSQLGCLHDGFADTYESMQDDLWDLIDRRRWNYGQCGSGIIFTGHSLGGALAQIGLLEAVACGLSGAAGITFGAPRIGTVRSDFFNYALTRVVGVDDDVPRLPPGGLPFWDYRDYGSPLAISRAEGEDPHALETYAKYAPGLFT